MTIAPLFNAPHAAEIITVPRGRTECEQSSQCSLREWALLSPSSVVAFLSFTEFTMSKTDQRHGPAPQSEATQPLLPSPLTVPRLLSKPANAVLVIDACSDAGDALITSLAKSGDCPITAVPNHRTATAEWEARMAALGVHVDRSVEKTVFAHDARRALIAAHPRVFLHYMHRFELLRATSVHPVSGFHTKDALLDWVRACHYERAQHVVYVSTVSPELFRNDDSCPECGHWEVEQKLRQLHAEGGIQHFTILRPANTMTVLVEDGKVDPLRVIARCDPTFQRQLIADADVGRIAARVLLQGSGFYERTLNLAADCLSVLQEVQVRSSMTGQAAQCDAQYWESYTRCAGWCGIPWWAIPQDELRAKASIAATRDLLPELLSYSSWFASEWKAAQERAALPTPVAVQHSCVLQ